MNSTPTNKPKTDRARAREAAATYAVSAVLVLCWASGFVVPRAFEAYAEPLTFVALRNGAALVILSAVALALRSPWPRGYVDLAGLIWSGAFLQGLSLSLMYWSVYHGIPVAIAALVGGLQPVVTALIASQVFDEALSAGQWLGIVVGFAGVALVVAPKLGATAGGFPAGLLLCCLLGVVSIAYGTLQQKRFEGTGRPSTRTAVMFAGALVPPAVGAAFFESPRVIWSPEFLVVYAWSTLALAIGATMALLFLVRRGAAARATSFLYLAPPGAAAMAHFGFGEPVTAIQLAGFAVSAVGVLLVQRRPASTAAVGARAA